MQDTTKPFAPFGGHIFVAHAKDLVSASKQNLRYCPMQDKNYWNSWCSNRTHTHNVYSLSVSPMVTVATVGVMVSLSMGVSTNKKPSKFSSNSTESSSRIPTVPERLSVVGVKVSVWDVVV